jgi:hypothetical protein
MDKAQFFAWSERQSRRFELANGPPGTPRRTEPSAFRDLHQSRVSARVDVGHSALLRHQGRFALESGPRCIHLPDVMVETYVGDNAISASDALLLVEVLSPSTMHVDFHEKLDEYKGLSGVGSYVICAQDEARVWVWTRSDGLGRMQLRWCWRD